MNTLVHGWVKKVHELENQSMKTEKLWVCEYINEW